MLKMIKIFSVLLANSDRQELWLGQADTLEDAIDKARITIREKLEDEEDMGVFMYNSMIINVVTSECELESPEDDMPSKNDIMNLIIKHKDKKMFKEFDSIFTTEELRYLKDKLKIKK